MKRTHLIILAALAAAFALDCEKAGDKTVKDECAAKGPLWFAEPRSGECLQLCSLDSDCGTGRFCDFGICAEIECDSQFCGSTESETAAGSCNNHRCSYFCGQGQTCPKGVCGGWVCETCQPNTQCGANMRCEGMGAFCRHYCETNEHCGPKGHCVYGTCVVNGDEPPTCNPDHTTGPCNCAEGYTVCLQSVDIRGNETGDGGGYCNAMKCVDGYWRADNWIDAPCYRCDAYPSEYEKDGDVNLDDEIETQSDEIDEHVELACEPENAGKGGPCGCEEGFTICLSSAFVPPSESGDGGGYCYYLQCNSGTWNYGQIMDAPCLESGFIDKCDYVPPKETDGDAAP